LIGIKILCYLAERKLLKNDRDMKNEVNDAGNFYISLLAKNKIFGESSFVTKLE